MLSNSNYAPWFFLRPGAI